MRTTYAEYRDAAIAVYDAVEAHQGKKRPHFNNFKSAAAKALGITRLYRARWEAVLKTGEREGLFNVNRHSLSYPFISLVRRDPLRLKDPARFEPGAYVCDNSMGSQHDEDTSDPDTADDMLEELAEQRAMKERNPVVRRYVLVRFPYSHADGHRGLHPYLDIKASDQAEVDRMVALARRQGATIVDIVSA